MSLTAKITTSIVAQQLGSSGLSTPEADVVKSYVENYANGTGADQAQVIWSNNRTLAGSASESLDLSGVLTDALGNSIALTAVKEIIVVPSSANTGDIRVGKKITNGFAGPFDQTAGALGVLATAGGILHLRNRSAAGWTVTAATGDLLSVENLSAGSSTYDIIVIGK